MNDDQSIQGIIKGILDDPRNRAVLAARAKEAFDLDPLGFAVKYGAILKAGNGSEGDGPAALGVKIEDGTKAARKPRKGRK